MFCLPLFSQAGEEPSANEELSYLEDGEDIKKKKKKKEKPVFRYNAVYGDYQLNVFNFDYVRETHTLTAFIALGINYDPFSLLYEAGIEGIDGRFSAKLYYSGSVVFIGDRVSNTLRNTINVGLAYNFGPVILDNTVSYGTIWLHSQSNEGAPYLLNAAHSIRNRLSLQAFLLNNGYLDIRLLTEFNYHYVIDKRANLYSLEFSFPMSFQLNRYFDWIMEVGSFFASSDTEGLGLRQSFLDNSLSSEIFKEEEETGTSANYGYEEIWGVWFSIKPRIYFLQSVKVNTAAKGIFLSPIIDLGVQFHDLTNLANNLFFLTLGGGLGYRFPGGDAIVLDVGYNNRENVVLRLFGNANF